MKKAILTFMLAVVGSATMFAQSEPTKMVIVQKDLPTAAYQLADIDSIYFQAESTASKVYKIDLPTDFSTGRVQKVMAGDKQVAEVCSEYVRSWGVTANAVDDVLTVVYPIRPTARPTSPKVLPLTVQALCGTWRQTPWLLTLLAMPTSRRFTSLPRARLCLPCPMGLRK